MTEDASKSASTEAGKSEPVASSLADHETPSSIPKECAARFAGTFDPVERAREKQASRDADALAIANGTKTRQQLRSENGAFAFPRARIRLSRSSPSAEAGGGLTGVESDIHGEPESAAPRNLHELRAELHAVREALLARDGEGTCDAVIRWRNDLRQLEADMQDIDDARGMLCGELAIDDPGNTVEIMRQAALAIGRHRLSTEALNKIRAELSAVEAKSSSHGSSVTDHSQCGLGTIDDGPRDSDCPCRTGVALGACAAAGCGFCRAEVSMRSRQHQGPRLSTETLNAQLRVLRNNWARDPEIALQEVLTDVDELLAACSTRTTGRRDG